MGYILARIIAILGLVQIVLKPKWLFVVVKRKRRRSFVVKKFFLVQVSVGKRWIVKIISVKKGAIKDLAKFVKESQN